MGKYVVKKGENIYDICLRLYGSIEGLLDLMVSNQDAISESGLSIYDTLQPGTELEYTDGYTVNLDIVSWFESNGIDIKNGEHIYCYYDIKTYASSFIKQKNTSVIETAFQKWPSIYDYPDVEEAGDIDAFLDYINLNVVWMANVSEFDIPLLIEDIESYTKLLLTPENIETPQMIISQIGNLSTFSFELMSGSTIIIDWGDNTPPEVYITPDATTAEHYYDDIGEHVIKIYGNVSFQKLDLRGINGTYYPLAEIRAADFNSDLMTNTTINRLIKRA